MFFTATISWTPIRFLWVEGCLRWVGFFPSYHAILPAIRVKEPCTRQVMMADNLKLYWFVICRNAYIYDYMYIMDWKVIVFTICYNFIVQIYNDIYSVYISYKGTVQIYIYIKCLENYLLSFSQLIAYSYCVFSNGISILDLGIPSQIQVN